MNTNEVVPTFETIHVRIFQAYLRMAEHARYRPQAPGNGFGTVFLTKHEAEDPERLDAEATRYADHFLKEEKSRTFVIGLSDRSTTRALVYTVEAARAMCLPDHNLALDLLKMALAETEVGEKEAAAR